MEGADAVYPASASALARGRRLRRAAAAAGAGAEPRARRRTVPVTFAEIKEVDEESAELGASAAESGAGAARRRRPDVLDERLAARRRRARDRCLRELSPPAAAAAAAGPGPGELARAGSEPAALHRPPEGAAGAGAGAPLECRTVFALVS